MDYIEKTLDKINEILLDNGCGLYKPDLVEIGNIIANTIIASTVDSTLKEEAIQWFKVHLGGD